MWLHQQKKKKNNNKKQHHGCPVWQKITVQYRESRCDKFSLGLTVSSVIPYLGPAQWHNGGLFENDVVVSFAGFVRGFQNPHVADVSAIREAESGQHCGSRRQKAASHQHNLWYIISLECRIESLICGLGNKEIRAKTNKQKKKKNK